MLNLTKNTFPNLFNIRFVGARMFSSFEIETSHLGRVFFLLFIGVMLFVMTNVLIAILNDAMDQVVQHFNQLRTTDSDIKC